LMTLLTDDAALYKALLEILNFIVCMCFNYRGNKAEAIEPKEARRPSGGGFADVAYLLQR